MMSSGVLLLLLTLFDNILASYPLKQCWRVSLLDFLQDSLIPEGVFEIANEMRSTVVILKTWKTRNQAKISGNLLYFCKCILL